jgi:uncharacterized membrane protein
VRLPDPRYGARGKQRSLHNNYLTLPVIFVMIGGHYPMVFATDYAWAILGLVLLIGAVIRHFFNTKHKGLAPPYWTWLVAGDFNRLCDHAVTAWCATGEI